MLFPENGYSSSKREWNISVALPNSIEKYSKNGSTVALIIEDGLFGRKIGRSKINEIINGINLIVLENYSTEVLDKLQKYTSDLKSQIENNLGWKDKLLNIFNRKTTLTNDRLSKLNILINRIDKAKTVADQSQEKLVNNPEKEKFEENKKIVLLFKNFGLSLNATGYDLVKAYNEKSYSKTNLGSYNAIVKAKKWNLPIWGNVQKIYP